MRGVRSAPPLVAPAARRRQRQLAIGGAVIAAVLLLANLCASAIGPHLSEPLYWPTYEIQHKYQRMLTARRLGVVFVGDSVLDTGANPALMGRACSSGCYNASLAGEPLPVLEEWTTKILLRHFHPSTVVVGFDASVLNGNLPGQGGLARQFHGSRPIAIAEGRGDILDRLDSWLHSHVSLYKYRAVLRHPFKDPAGSAAGVYNPPLSAVGWNSDFIGGKLSAALAAEAAGAPLNTPLTSFVESPAKVHELGQFIAQLRRQGVAVVFVSMPVPPAYLATIPGGRATYTKAVTDMTAEARVSGATVLAQGIWPTSVFADRVHLNGAGTARLSAWLGRHLSGGR